MKISIIIPNFNGAQLLRRNLPKILASTGNAEVIVVDDASSDVSIEEIKSQKSKVKSIKLIQNKTNLGFSSTVNRGVEAASGDLVILLNTDVIPKKNYLESLIKHFEDPQVFAVGSKQYSFSWEKKMSQGRGIGEFKKGFLMHRPGDTNINNTLWVFGGAGIYRKSIWKKLGGMVEIYNPFYWEDIDLSYRALKSGYKLVFEPKSLVRHSPGGTIGKSFTKEKIKMIAYRNQIFFVWLNITDWQLILKHLFYLPYHLVKALLTFDLPFIEAFFQAVIKLPQVYKKRCQNLKFFRKTDDEILRNFSQ